MSKFSREIKDFFIISFTTVILFFIHQFLFLEIFENEKVPLISIYFFNYFAVLVFLGFFKLNLYYKLTNPNFFCNTYIYKNACSCCLLYLF